ncbi:MAG: hypothetical protein ACI9R3_005502 [Verrucomicrobiales bacterium]|jgi:hypothetical protein
MNLFDVLPDEDFRQSMRFSKGEPSGFYGRTKDHDEILAQRSRLLRGESFRYAMLSSSSEGQPLLDEAIDIARETGGINGEQFDSLNAQDDSAGKCQLLGACWEPDFLLMKSVDGGPHRLVGGCVCFPSNWSLEEKLGRPMVAIHSPVPDLNDDLGRQIDGFLSKIKPGISWERSNWGLAATAQLNLHPELPWPRLHSDVTADDVWLRIEWQSLVALPVSGGVLFGIRLQIVPLREVMQSAELARRLNLALTTMSAETLRYKGFAQCRERLSALLCGEMR